MTGMYGHREMLRDFLGIFGPSYIAQGVGSYEIHTDGRGSPKGGRILVEEGWVLRLQQRVGEDQYRVVAVSKPDQNLSYHNEPTDAFMQMVKHKLEEKDIPFSELPDYLGKGAYFRYGEIPSLDISNIGSVLADTEGIYLPDISPAELLSLKTGWRLETR